ncbi:hypothetical protein SAMN05216331_1392 [Porphyromonadaceae bacterium KH3R12]|nr:hypothetical protein SAMN05216331_1392 [Porphyromonadaceae bacterium KH3R12]
MEAKKLSPPKLPLLLPHGWKKEVALTLGIHPNTVSRALPQLSLTFPRNPVQNESGRSPWR